MIFVTIDEKGGATRRLDLDKGEVTIGRVTGNDIVLPKGNVSKQHCRVVLKDGRFIVVDLKSTNGTYVNGKKISGPQVLKPGDKLNVGDFALELEEGGEAAEEEPEAREEAEADGGDEKPSSTSYERGNRKLPGPPVAERKLPSVSDSRPSSRAAAKPGPKSSELVAVRPSGGRDSRAAKALDPKVERHTRLQKEIHDRLIDYLDLRRLDIDKLGDEELWNKTERAVKEIITQMEADGEIDGDVDRSALFSDVLNEALGLGPLEGFLADEQISEIMVNHANQIYCERKGKLLLSEKTFSSNTAVMSVIERIVSPIGRRIDESSPLVDARLKDGSRVNAIIPPLALKGPCITIRKFKKEKLLIDDLIHYKTLTPQMAEFLEMCVKARKNIVISGGTGSGKTTTLNIISSFIPDGERIVTVEDAAELQLTQDHWVQLESRPPNLEGKGAITIRDLVKNCLRMRPDRIVVGECRSGETLDMLQAMNTGHDGSLTTLHANTPRDAIARMETMVLMAGMDLPIRAIREQIASAVNIIVQQTRFADGARRITHITEVSGMEVDVVTLQSIFEFHQEGFDEQGQSKGRYVASGFVPKFYDELQRRGIPVNMHIFREE